MYLYFFLFNRLEIQTDEGVRCPPLELEKISATPGVYM
jgi:hypothetical protein